MKPSNIVIFSSFLFAIYSCNLPSSNSLPRISIAGLGIESSTFSPAQIIEEAFHAQQGVEIMYNYPFLKRESENISREKCFHASRGKSLLIKSWAA